ncbi:ADP-ribosylglycohydrolase family protein [Acrocarpospora catenulata]|uniref:ADP-ribosylglycohydrolase family protein n=1 Tax=Acrocarpospora catenulata TaxID=2836182 RepID=UPI001BDA1F7A|nr:ADP-ribosylglycohydrolase family protein [Acrocarpospora catenulata]
MLAAQIASAIRGLAAGDALGVPWETAPPEKIDRARLHELPASRDWPPGATSDDTDQMLIVARLLADTLGQPTAEEFMRRLSAQAGEIRGLGSTTRRALRDFAETGRVANPGVLISSAGALISSDISDMRRASNGAAMRIAPVGWMVPAGQARRRRELVVELSRGTHGHPVAIGAAAIVAAMAAYAIEDPDGILPAAVAEAEWLSMPEFADVRHAAEGSWTPPSGGISVLAAPTVAAVTHAIHHSTDLATAQTFAVTMGGDTDTVAAIVGGILGAVPGQPVPPWWDKVHFPADPEADALAARLAELR